MNVLVLCTLWLGDGVPSEGQSPAPTGTLLSLPRTRRLQNSRPRAAPWIGSCLGVPALV